MNIEALAKTINSIGLLLDILGAWFVAIEVVKQYKGQKYRNDVTIDELDEPVRETEYYKKYEKAKYKYMVIGLACLTIGFSFQIISNWPCLLKLLKEIIKV